jgi:hypothetical protein
VSAEECRLRLRAEYLLSRRKFTKIDGSQDCTVSISATWHGFCRTAKQQALGVSAELRAR